MKMTKTLATIAMLFLPFVASCKSAPKIEKPKTPVAIQVYDTANDVAKSAEAVKANSEKIATASESITESASTIRGKTDDPVIVKEAENITQQSNVVENANIEIKKEVESIVSETNAEKVVPILQEVERLEKTDSEWKAKYEDLLAASTAEMQKIIRIFWIIGFAMIVAGLVIAYFHRIIGGIILCAGFVSVGLAAANQYYYQEIATVGLGVFIIGFLTSVTAVGFFIFKNKKSEDAVADNVKLIEEIKTEIPDEAKAKIFGENGIAQKVQKSSTQKIVKEIKSKIK